MGNCYKSQFYERRKEQQADKQNQVSNKVDNNDRQYMPPKTDDVIHKQGLSIDIKQYNQSKKVQYLPQEKKVKNVPELQDKNKGQTCKLISNYGNPCKHPECSSSFAPQTYDSKQIKNLRYPDQHNNKYENELE